MKTKAQIQQLIDQLTNKIKEENTKKGNIFSQVLSGVNIISLKNKVDILNWVLTESEEPVTIQIYEQTESNNNPNPQIG